MNETLHQLGGLLLGSVPTIFLFLLLVILYRFLVYGPLTRVLNERRERTEGAIEQAHAAIAAAAARRWRFESPSISYNPSILFADMLAARRIQPPRACDKLAGLA